jgi:hypothetical protein
MNAKGEHLKPFHFKQGNHGKLPGTRNRITREVKEILEEVFDKHGGVPALLKWAETHETEFYTNLWSKLIPRDLNLTIGMDQRLLDAIEETRDRVLALNGNGVEAVRIIDTQAAEVK